VSHLVAVGLGSNLGNRQAHLDYACCRLTGIFSGLRTSPPHETSPVGAAGPDFLNAAAVGRTNLTARAVLEALLRIERDRGRERPYPAAPRTLDLDLLLFDRQVIAEPGLIVPHPRFRERRFVLEPLAEIASQLRDPVTGKTIAELLSHLPEQ
jgi:2-amino-4-hydroxy-6-hydroxymethyldihydropteridine diphosphokinase